MHRNWCSHCSRKRRQKTKTIIKNGSVVTPEGVLEGFDVILDGERIESIIPSGSVDTKEVNVMDADGGWVMPGLIDIHADFIENMAAPRPTSILDMGMAFREAERILAVQGITTMFHSISFISKLHAFSSPIRAPELTRKLLTEISDSHSRKHLIHHRFHARFELDSVDRIEEIQQYIREGKIHLLSIMDHTPGQGQYRDMNVYRDTMKKWKNLDDESVERLVTAVQNRAMLGLEEVTTLTDLAHEYGIAVASHDDDTIEKLDVVQAFGSDISEFPITLEVAREARRRGMYSVAGAPNVLLGGSHSGNLSAAEAVDLGVVDVLCSDYYPASLLRSVFKLHHDLEKPLHEMVNLVTINPARAVKIGQETGSLEPGKCADILVVRDAGDENGFHPTVSDVLVSGHHVLGTSYRSGQGGSR
ncbi:MAG: alpha-D-ribose 1-methylphosphonate 5-triphosphate diphosphatase [Spirochaetaceae bacterium]|nr:alpha-D-ribose 1-methylphosphonate 5-triphosphate diphosphatase [Spirochaetaceae bacterium]MDT8296910.1 alpha-D-ribose 1-methylphosphonate 5-triphosphate diphosphatase [Spirochaetaceae bacterium]